MAKLKWTLDLLEKEAKKYSTRGDFQKYSYGAYLSATRQNLLDKVCEHMVSSRISWNSDLVLKEALKHKTRSSFVLHASGAYRWAIANDYLEECTRHMVNPKVKWTKETIKTEALKHTTRNKFKHACSSAYQAACKLGILADVCTHMKPPQTAWNPITVELEAKKYVTRNAFKRGSYGAYQAAHRLNMIDDICTHMEYVAGAFKYDKPAYLYYVKITTKNKDIPDVYKIGITGRSYILDRFYNDRLVTTTDIEVLHKQKFLKGIDAFKKEQELLTMYTEYNYSGKSPLVHTKTTEMFYCDLRQHGLNFRNCNVNGDPLE